MLDSWYILLCAGVGVILAGAVIILSVWLVMDRGYGILQTLGLGLGIPAYMGALILLIGHSLLFAMYATTAICIAVLVLIAMCGAGVMARRALSRYLAYRAAAAARRWRPKHI